MSRADGPRWPASARPPASSPPAPQGRGSRAVAHRSPASARLPPRGTVPCVDDRPRPPCHRRVRRGRRGPAAAHAVDHSTERLVPLVHRAAGRSGRGRRRLHVRTAAVDLPVPAGPASVPPARRRLASHPAGAPDGRSTGRSAAMEVGRSAEAACAAHPAQMPAIRSRRNRAARSTAYGRSQVARSARAAGVARCAPQPRAFHSARAQRGARSAAPPSRIRGVRRANAPARAPAFPGRRSRPAPRPAGGPNAQAGTGDRRGRRPAPRPSGGPDPQAGTGGRPDRRPGGGPDPQAGTVDWRDRRPPPRPSGGPDAQAGTDGRRDGRAVEAGRSGPRGARIGLPGRGAARDPPAPRAGPLDRSAAGAAPSSRRCAASVRRVDVVRACRLDCGTARAGRPGRGVAPLDAAALAPPSARRPPRPPGPRRPAVARPLAPPPGGGQLARPGSGWRRSARAGRGRRRSRAQATRAGLDPDRPPRHLPAPHATEGG